ncbi:hypothetical protein NF348_05805 [Devosia sp. XJ19-45]|uniref:Uncharacterized protein n=1 Tax=Devosia ureilytica TaxID=2952754 RepID=A0A9Q4FQT9_9HYPH|nr:hypothetical protein [Devosia ureilytica]
MRSVRRATRFPQSSYTYSLDDCSVTFHSHPDLLDADASVATSSGEQNVFVSNYYCASNSSTLSPNSARGQQFAALTSAVKKLSELPSYHSLYVDPEVCVRATDLLGLLSAQTDVDPPRLFPQDEETLALTWTQGRFIRMLSIDEDDLSLVDLDKKSQHRCLHELPADHSAANLLPALGVLPKVSTAG